jgi:hypothetical protein
MSSPTTLSSGAPSSIYAVQIDGQFAGKQKVGDFSSPSPEPKRQVYTESRPIDTSCMFYEMVGNQHVMLDI